MFGSGHFHRDKDTAEWRNFGDEEVVIGDWLKRGDWFLKSRKMIGEKLSSFSSLVF
jgi:hypothetical protein